jgi:hypothetical protein
MPWLIAIVLGVATVALLSGRSAGDRPPIAEGRSWRLVAGAGAAAGLKLSNVADLAARLVGERAWVMVVIENKRPEQGRPSRQPVIVVADKQIGPTAIAGHFFEDLERPIPAPWGPAPGTPVEFAIEDIWLIIKD